MNSNWDFLQAAPLGVDPRSHACRSPTSRSDADVGLDATGRGPATPQRPAGSTIGSGAPEDEQRGR
jgi:hypothetical protein